MLLTLTLQVFVVVFVIALLWHIFEKAGQPGWASLVPGYNIYILLKITGLVKSKCTCITTGSVVSSCPPICYRPVNQLGLVKERTFPV